MFLVIPKNTGRYIRPVLIILGLPSLVIYSTPRHRRGRGMLLPYQSQKLNLESPLLASRHHR
jgi:hypothetical protein